VRLSVTRARHYAVRVVLVTHIVNDYMNEKELTIGFADRGIVSAVGYRSVTEATAAPGGHSTRVRPCRILLQAARWFLLGSAACAS
jgi:hypothetical protein